MITSTTYNDAFNEMDWDYLRSKVVTPFPERQGPTNIPPSLNIPEIDSLNCDCCSIDKTFIYQAIADATDSDTYKNDYLSVLYQAPIGTVSVTHVLQKYNGISFVDTVTLSSTYGTVYAPGIWPDYPTFFGYKLAFRQVLIHFGEGTYRIKTTITTFGSDTDFYSRISCLKAYSVNAADQTVKFEWYNNGIITYADDSFEEVDYGNINWQEMIRLKGSFGYQTEEQEVVETSFFYGDSLRTERIHDKVNYKYKFKSAYYPWYVHSILKNIAFRSNALSVTTYGQLEKKQYVSKEILKESNGYSPEYDKVHKKEYRVDVDFRDKYEDLGARKNCTPSGQNCEPVTIKDENGNIIATVPAGGTYII